MDFPNQPQVPMNQPGAGSSSSKMKWIIIGVVAVVVVAAVVWYFASNNGGKVLGASTSSTYQAVFLSNGQVYFGKLEDQGNWIELSDIYYLQVTQNLQAASTADQAKTATPSTDSTGTTQPNIQLVKLGSELHGPKDVMHIERDKVLFWEDMKDDSKVISAIKQYKSK
jgi:flagellar basal body-associated protein FliL